MAAPSDSEIEQLKEKHSDRALHLVEMQRPGDEEIVHLVMVGANHDEYKKFTDDIWTARKEKTEAEKNEKLDFIARQAILRQTVWPDRDEVKSIIFKNPGFVDNLAQKIHELAGSSAEVRSKKL
jgi:hypothetical protein